MLDSSGVAEVVLEDVLRDGDAWLVHRYRGYLPSLTAHFIERSYYEGGHYLLVFPGGGLVGVAGPPLVSPDGSRFVTWNLDLVAEYSPNVLQIWRRTPGGARLELALESELWGPHDVRWLDSATIRFQQAFPTDDPNSPRLEPAELRWRSGRWEAAIRVP